MLASFLFKVKDHRRKQRRQYQLGHILLFSILAIVSGAESYRKIHAFIQAHYTTLNETFDLGWKRIPAYTTIRYIIRGVSSAEIEARFREYAVWLTANADGQQFVAFDGKVIRGSFDHFKDQKAIQVLSAFLTGSDIILAHEEIAEKTNEIPIAQEMMAKLGLSDCVFTFDAINCQTKTLAAAKASGNDVIVQVKEMSDVIIGIIVKLCPGGSDSHTINVWPGRSPAGLNIDIIPSDRFVLIHSRGKINALNTGRNG